METEQRLGLPKTPSVARRNCLALVLGLLCAPSTVVAQPSDSTALAARAPLSEADIIRMTRSRSPAGKVAKATDELADARARTAGPYPNPSLSWMRETVETGPVGSEDTFTATLPIDIARPRATRSLVASQSAWTRAEASLSRTDAVLGTVLAYYDVALAEGRARVLAQSLANLEEAARVLERREPGFSTGRDQG